MTESHAYTKKWKDFGRHAQFDDTETKILGTVPPDPNQADEYVQRDPNRINLSNIPQQSMHSVSNRPFCTFHFSNFKCLTIIIRLTPSAFLPLLEV